MDLEDLFEGKHHRSRGGRDNHDGHGGHDDPHGHDDHRDERHRDHQRRLDRPAHGDPGRSEGHDSYAGYLGGDQPHGLQRELLAKLLASKPALVAVAGAALLLLVLATWLVVAAIGAMGQGGLGAAVEAVIAPVKTLVDGVQKPGKAW